MPGLPRGPDGRILRPVDSMNRSRRTGRLAVLALLALAGCHRGGDRGRPAEAEADSGAIALPPSAAAPRTAPDTAGEAPPVVRDRPGPMETVGPVPPPVLDVGAIVSGYRKYYGDLFSEMGSAVRGDVDPKLVEEAKHRTALDFGFVKVSAWKDMVGRLSAAQRSDLDQRIAAANRDLATRLHGRPPAPR